MPRLISLIALLLVTLTAQPSFAAPLRVYVAEMNVIGVQNRDEMKYTLQTLLASRLTGERITTVASAAEADAVVTGTYVVIGKVFSVDALAKTTAGKTVTRSFVQAENQDELIPSIGKLADKLAADLIKIYAATPALLAAPAKKSDLIRSDWQSQSSPGDIIRSRAFETAPADSGWLSKRLNGAANLMAVGKTLSDGSREIFLAEDRRVSYYRQGSDMTLVTEMQLGDGYKIISLDTLEGADGNLDIYVTILRAEELASQVWQVKGDKLLKVAENLPWYFRSFALAGGPKKLFVQTMGRDDDFYGDVSEATRKGSNITIKKPIKMPRFGNLYTFNQFKNKDGKTYTVVINPDNYLIVFDQEQQELWRSNDKFGGSELYFKRDNADIRVTGDKYRWIFMNTRIQVSAAGDILVGKNDGFWVLGNSRSYKRGAVYCLGWSGSSLEEKWRTRDTQNYMPDYYFDEARNELLILQTVQRPGISARGATSLSIKKVE